MIVEDILQNLCTSYSLKTSSEFQDVYAIDDAKEAKLAFDIIRSYGIEAKVYAENDGSKLYITKSPATESDKSEVAKIYATALKSIKSDIETLCSAPGEHPSDYTMSFNTAPNGTRQIIINIATNTPAPVVSAAPVSATTSVRNQPAAMGAKTGVVPPKPPTPGAPPISKYARPPAEDTMFSGPQLLRDNNKLISKKEMEKRDSDSYWYQLSLYIKGNSAVATCIIVLIIVALFSVFSMFVVSKGFLCPDLATRKSSAWYCRPLMGE